MKTIERQFTDKTDWPVGPWHDEYDKKQWLDVKTGLPCLIVRGPVGALCGYVGVPKGHEYYGACYDDVPADAHGGLTFSGKCQEDADEGICHVVEVDEDDDVWWLGFDCAHAGDYAPGIVYNAFRCPNDVYRDVEYVAEECRKLAEQVS